MPRVAQLDAEERGAPAPRIRTRRKAKTHTQYFAFLSYSHRDEDLAKWLQRKLEQFQVPASLVGRLTANGAIPRRLTPIFRDEHELAAADDLGSEIEAALDSSQCLIVLCSPAAAASKWVNAEIATFKRVRPDGCVLAAIAAGEPFASDIGGREQEECFPPALRYRFDRRGRQTTTRAEPLAADLRHEGDPRRAGFLKLVAGMLGVSLDELVQREATQRHRRLAWVTTGSVVGMALAIVLAVAAVQARDEARDQRREAEGLVAFMLGDLKNKLEPIGRLDALDGVGSRVLAYYSKQDPSELSDAALLQRASALGLSAQVAFQRNNLDEAARLYRQAAAGTGEAVRRSPEDPQRLYDHAQNIFWVGEIARSRGDNSAAETAFREYKRLADQMVAIDPDNLRWRMEMLYAQENLGIVLLNQRRFGEAAKQLNAALRPMENLLAIDEGNIQYREEFSNILGWAADSERDAGRLEAAIRLRERQIALVRSALGRAGTNVQLRRQLIPAHQGLGVLQAMRGAAEPAIAQFRQAVAEADRLIPIEPANMLWKGQAAAARLELARTLFAARRTAEAAREMEAGCVLASQVREKDPTGSWRRLQTDCLTIRAHLALQSNYLSRAEVLAQQAVASAQSERRPDPVSVRYRVAAALSLLGDVHARSRRPERSREAWSRGLSALAQERAERPGEMNIRAGLLRRLGRKDEAQQLEARVSATGFRQLS
ncbi:toll/interleukin-1 receptor domain-containing protein [Sphingomonas lutea]|uniref:Toll/interleukin-1 receptor domain-containing protein n=1 Tax=Sphingomonas lutea TaxID=1045317 RepID=A0A7G9SIQ7_9SPHN|nr:toll/interleukin-1 receptor domain-containing protein [Sphingomonas lutea]QNN67732.1 toll/interleukin-1 receptor domain-containing protein [Sphingomonas lutea]